MMKCEKCGKELIGGAIICRRCDHNNARQFINEWRSRRPEPPRKPATGPKAQNGATIPSKAKAPLTSSFDANLIRFPAEQHPATATSQTLSNSEEPKLAEYRDWREQVKEKVRLAREKKASEKPAIENQPDEVALDPNPIVESALKRIRWSSHTQPASAPSRTIKPGLHATALAEAIDFAPEPITGPAPEEVRPIQPAVKPVNQHETQPAISRPARQPVIARTAAPPVEVKTPAPKPRVEPKVKIEPGRQAPAPEPRLPPAARAQGPKPEPKRPETRPPIESSRKFNETQIIEVPLFIAELSDIFSRPATTWVRTLAGACDFEMISMAYLPVFAAYATLNTSLGREAFFILLILLAAIIFVYQAVTLSLADRTFGMALLNLRLINNEDETLPITRRQRLLRAWGATIAFLFPPLNFLIMRLNRLNRSLPDLISGTTPVEQ